MAGLDQDLTPAVARGLVEVEGVDLSPFHEEADRRTCARHHTSLLLHTAHAE